MLSLSALKFKVSHKVRQKIENDESLSIVATRLQKSFVKMSLECAQFFVYEMERYYRQVLEYMRPQLLFIWNRHQPANGVIDIIAQRLHIPILYMESGELPGTVFIDADGQSGESWVTREPEKFLSLPITDSELMFARQLLKRFYNSKENRRLQKPDAGFMNALEHIDHRNPNIFFAGDFDPGTGIYPSTTYGREFYSPLFYSSFQALEYLAKLAKANGWNLLYKPHPICLQWQIEPEKCPKNVIFTGKGDINELIDVADLVVGITTSVAYMSLIREKATLLLGYNLLKDKGCTYQAFSRESIEPTIKEALHQGFTEMQRKAFRKHVAQMNKYFLFDNLVDRPERYGRNLKDMVRLIQNKVERKE